MLPNVCFWTSLFVSLAYGKNRAIPIVCKASVGSPRIAGQTTSTHYTAIPTIASAQDYAPSLTPNVYDKTAPDSQVVCKGYKAEDVQTSASGLTANLIAKGPACNTYGTEIDELSLLVEYQSKERLHVQVIPRYLVPANRSQFFLAEYISGYPSVVEHAQNDLDFKWTNSPSFQFQVVRNSTGESIFSTYGSVLVYQNQFLELRTSMVEDYNVYGLAENIHDFRLGNNYTQTFWAVDAGNTINGNVYGTHPVYLETRYNNKTGVSSSHGVYMRNAHGQDILLRSKSLTWRSLGGAMDLYFLSGTTPKQVIQQYQKGIVGLPVQQMVSADGAGRVEADEKLNVVDNYRKANIPLETIWTDIDYMSEYRDFTNGALNFPVGAGQAFLSKLHAAGQHYVPIVDANLYAPDPTNKSDSYEPFERGADSNAFIRNGADSFYYGANWPGYSVWADWLVSQSQDLWSYELSDWYKRIPYDGIWIDLSEASSYCVGSCGQGRLGTNPAHVPFLLPGDPGMLDFDYPESFNVTNKTEAASAASASSSQVSAYPPASTTGTMTLGRTTPTPGVRDLNFPPYVINNFPKSGYSLGEGAIMPNATHNDEHNSTEYDLHNVFGHQILNATREALLKVFPGRRPWVIGRSTFAGTGTIGAHWLGDNHSKWGSMYLSISQALQFAIAGIPMVGADTCGFTGNSDYELCTRWMALSAFFPFYRNHNVIASISQEAYVWAATAESSRRAMAIRYSLLPYIYTLFQSAHTTGSTLLTALQWEFPNDASLASVDNQFMLGPSLLITPVLQPQVDYVKGVFPGVPDTTWYDWYTLEAEQVAPHENKTLSAPLEHINVHIRSGSILPTQQPGYTTKESRQNPFGLIVALDPNGEATGTLYLDDGMSLEPNATKMVSYSYAKGKLAASVEGKYVDNNALANITVAGMKSAPKQVMFQGKDVKDEVQMDYANEVLRMTGVGSLLPKAYMKSWDITFA
ncbi:MAG: hypothetical protein M1828_004437 [Chrysothrix sp. TS-e1954]|nr:MAG: hypothetical protein M1828_004437 [Chrysothrix sp. TS-e1954]